MKFLIAATLLCLALFGQSRAGSLRGFTVPVPHQVYGVPVLDNEIHIEETQPIVEDSDSVSVDLKTHEEPIVLQPSSEYGAPAVAHEVKTVPFVDTLPLVDSVVSFGKPSETYGFSAKPTTPKPELPYLEPGLPTLPKAPVVLEVSNEYLPPVGGTTSVFEEYVPSTDEAPLVVQEGKPSEVYGPPATAEIVLPTIHEIPALPEAPTTVTPAFTVEHSAQNFYENPAIGFPTLISYTSELPSQPATAFIVAVGTPSEIYGSPAKPTTPKPELPYLESGLPTLPEAPVVPEVPEVSVNHVEVSNEYLPPVDGTTSVFEEYVPSTDEAPLVVQEGKPSEVYGPPATAEIILPTIHEIPALPEAPTTVKPATTQEHSGQYFYEPPAIGFPTLISHTPELPSQPANTLIVTEDRPSETYGPPAHEEHKPSGPYGVANVPVHIPELPTTPLTTFASENARPSEIYGLLAKMPEYIAPAVAKDQKVPVEVPKEYFYEPPAVAFPTPVSVQPTLPEIKNLPAEAPGQYSHKVPAKAFPTPVTTSVGHGIVSHSGFVENSASSSSSSSSLHVNKYAVPLAIQPHPDSVIITELNPIREGFAIHSVAGSLENTSTGLYKQVSIVNHLVPQLSPFGTIVGLHQPVANSVPIPVPHDAYGVANF